MHKLPPNPIKIIIIKTKQLATEIQIKTTVLSCEGESLKHALGQWFPNCGLEHACGS